MTLILTHYLSVDMRSSIEIIELFNYFLNKELKIRYFRKQFFEACFIRS